MAFNLFKGIRVSKTDQNPPYESFLESRGFPPEIHHPTTKSDNSHIDFHFGIHLVGKAHVTACCNGNFALPSSNGGKVCGRMLIYCILREVCLSDLAVMARHYFITQKFFMN